MNLGGESGDGWMGLEGKMWEWIAHIMHFEILKQCNFYQRQLRIASKVSLRVPFRQPGEGCSAFGM